MNAKKQAAKEAREQGICPQCGKQVSEYANFCGDCGCDLKNGQSVQEWQARHPRRRFRFIA